MVTLDQLPASVSRGKKRLGRGYGSGKGGHTSSRGQKGQKSRTTAKLLFEGTKTNKDFFRRTPWLRGKNRLKSFNEKPVLIQSSSLSVFKAGDEVDLKALTKKKLIPEKTKTVKILFDKDPGVKLILKVPASKAAIKALQA
ncbi:hypothetical protein GYA49_01045 [Candidatus Beckwithbacteria bacterium]|nr:hypothetical protein [Candidatus Beckwithbacteria bacterium]